ncbi:hypothetical protein Tco_0413216 [Tanacetum coccineum]
MFTVGSLSLPQKLTQIEENWFGDSPLPFVAVVDRTFVRWKKRLCMMVHSIMSHVWVLSLRLHGTTGRKCSTPAASTATSEIRSRKNKERQKCIFSDLHPFDLCQVIVENAMPRRKYLPESQASVDASFELQLAPHNNCFMHLLSVEDVLTGVDRD